MQDLEMSLQALKTSYRVTGDISTSLTAAYALEGQFRDKPSVALGNLRLFICELELYRGASSTTLELVENMARGATEAFWSSANAGAERQSMAALYLSVAAKAAGDKDEAFKRIERAKKSLRKYYDTDYLDEISLTRQEALMSQEDGAFADLLENVPTYINQEPVEAYASLKRVFERCLNKGLTEQARLLQPTLMETFRRAADDVSPLGKISFQKNLGHYYLLTDDHKRADKILSSTLRQARALEYVGQEKQITTLLEDRDAALLPRLSSFRSEKE